MIICNEFLVKSPQIIILTNSIYFTPKLECCFDRVPEIYYLSALSQAAGGQG